jgi:hypothetical protein
MQTFDQHLMDLVAEDVVTYETALTASSNPADFQLQVRTLRRRPRATPTQSATPAAAPAPAPEPAAAQPDKPDGFTDDLSSMLPP